MSNKFFTADLHFGHKNIIKFSNPRFFSTIEDHDEKIISNWNSVIDPDDTVYILGDISLNLNQEKLETYLQKLHGKKHLILGNHDRAKVYAKFLNNGLLESMRDYAIEKIYDNQGRLYECVLFHYPILEPNHIFNKPKIGKYGPVCHFYGHIHNINNYDEIYKKLGFRAANVGLDVSDKYPNTELYTPINFEDLLTWFDENY